MFKTKRLLSLLLAIVMIASLAVTSMISVSAEGWNGTKTTEPMKGSGTAEDPWQIETAENLAWLSAAVLDPTIAKAFADENIDPDYKAELVGLGKYDGNFASRKVFAGMFFKQTADIDLNNQAFTPIGTYWAGTGDSATRNLFGGSYDGAGYKISNATVTAKETITTNITILTAGGGGNDLKEATQVTGLFGGISAGSVVKNVNACNIDVGTYSNNKFSENIAGVIVGFAIEATIDNCTTDAACSVNGVTAGGIVGYIGDTKLSDMNVKNCVNNATVNATYAAGGIVGVANGDISWCVNNGNVTLYSDVIKWACLGGIVGVALDASYNASIRDTVEIKYCVNSAKASLSVNMINASQNRIAAGGIIGNQSILSNGATFGRTAQDIVMSYCYNLATEIAATNMTYNPDWVAAGGIMGYVVESRTEQVANDKPGVPKFDHCYSVAGVVRYSETVAPAFNEGQYTNAAYDAPYAGIISGGLTTSKAPAYIDAENAWATCTYGMEASEIEKDIIYKSIIEATDIETNDITYVGVQDSLIKGTTYSVRFIAGLSNTAYKAAGFKVTINGITKTYTSEDAYTTLTGIANTGDTKTYVAADYGYEAFTALVIKDIPTGTALTIEITPLVVTGNTTLEGNAYTVVYDANGYFVSQCASQPQD